MSPRRQAIRFNVVLFGDNPDQLFNVKIKPNDNVSDLRKLVKEKKKPDLDAISATDIKLYKVDLSEYEELSLGAFTDRIREVIPAKGLFPTLKVHDIFPSGSPQSDSNLHIVAVCSESLCSLSAATARKILVDMNEAEENDEASDDDSTVFDADDIRTAVAKMGYRIDFPLFGHPLVAMVSSVTDDSIGFIKFAPDGRKETQILQYLLGIDSPRNHTIAGARVWPVHGGQIISMPVGGGWLTDMSNADAQLWSVAGQLIEAVDFMHQHGVAHLDLKPANILIPKGGGRLSIVDFHTSRRIKGVKTMLHGVVGTPKYIPPEVEARCGRFSALRADLWSCGKVLSELCDLCQPSMDRATLFQISRKLMDVDPEKRPMTSGVLERMADYKGDGDARPQPNSDPMFANISVISAETIE